MVYTRNWHKAILFGVALDKPGERRLRHPPMNPMLGARLKELRVRAGWSLPKLAMRAGIDLPDLRHMEGGASRLSDGLALVAVSDALGLGIDELAYLLSLNKRGRRFQAYCVGLPKSGTSSIAGIFSGYVSCHEFMVRETVEHLIRFNRGELSDRQMRSFVRRRDTLGLLEMDSASFNGAYLDFLRDEFPSAKFIFTILRLLLMARLSPQHGVVPSGIPGRRGRKPTCSSSLDWSLPCTGVGGHCWNLSPRFSTDC